jgi:hypothetical protein
MLSELLKLLLARFRQRVQAKEPSVDPLTAYIDGALALDATSDLVAARCWVGVFAEAVRNPVLFAQVRRLLDTEMMTIERRSGGRVSAEEAGAMLAFIIGALVFGAFAPRKTAGFAAPALRKFAKGAVVPGSVDVQGPLPNVGVGCARSHARPRAPASLPHTYHLLDRVRLG